MGVFTYTNEHSSTVSAARLFKALVLDSHNLIPKIMPQIVKSIEFIRGNGGAGSIKQINFAEGSKLKSVKNRVDEVNEDTLTYKYTIIEGEALGDKLESITVEVKFEAKPDGGSNNKVTSKFYTKGNFELKEEEIKDGEEKALAIHKMVETYLLQNPNVYA